MHIGTAGLRRNEGNTLARTISLLVILSLYKFLVARIIPSWQPYSYVTLMDPSMPYSGLKVLPT